MLFTSGAVLACLATAIAAELDTPLTTRQGCAKGYELCVANGATSGLPPSMGDGLFDLYADLVNSINAAKEKRSPVPQRLPGRKNVKRNDYDSDDDYSDDDSDDEDVVPDLCCKADAGMQCLLLEGVRISFCWDRFTTNYHFADGSYGNIVKGDYKTSDGDVFNLINGSYTLYNGDKGNFYEEEDAPFPKTATLALPTPWTSSGVGTAIPGSELGAPATHAETSVRTIPATTIPDRTVSGEVIPGTTIAATTITGAAPATATATATTTGEEATQTGDDDSAGQALKAGGLFAPWMCMIAAGLYVSL